MQITQPLLIRTTNVPEVIYEHLHYGTNLPIFPRMKRYILHEITRMGFQSLILQDKDVVVGHSCFYFHEDTMYFAFFGVPSEEPELIDRIIEELVSIARENAVTYIKGPINFPHVIYGWGFSEKKSSKKIFAAAPYTNPDYITHFEQAGFYIDHRILRFRVPMLPIPYEKPAVVESVDFSKREEWKDTFIDFQLRLFPKSTQVTPNIIPFFDDCLDFIEDFGYGNMILFAYDEDKPIGLGWATPNPFDLYTGSENKEKGRYNKCRSVLLFGGAIEPEYQKRGILKQIIYQWVDIHSKAGLTHGEMPIGEDNAGSIKMAKSYCGRPKRSHVVMKLEL